MQLLFLKSFSFPPFFPPHETFSGKRLLERFPHQIDAIVHYISQYRAGLSYGISNHHALSVLTIALYASTAFKQCSLWFSSPFSFV